MTKVDRYILRNFFKTLIFCYICLIGLYVVFDLFTNMEQILTAGKESNNPVVAIVRYYFFNTFQFFDILVSLLIMISAMITLSTMIRHNELIPLMAAGVSQLRIIMPIIGAAVLVTFLAMACRELLLPRYLDDLLKTPAEIGRNTGTKIDGITDFKTGIQLRAELGYWQDRTIKHPIFVLSSRLTHYGKNIEAETGQYVPRENGKPEGYMLKNIIAPKELLSKESLKIDDQPIVITHQDAPDWVAATDCFVVSGITFDQLAGGEKWRQYGSTYELVQGARNPSLALGSKVYAVIHSRVTQPFLDFTLLMLGLPIILSKADRNVFKALGFGTLLIMTFLTVQLVSKNIGIAYHQPVLGAWFPLILFIPIASWLFSDIIK